MSSLLPLASELDRCLLCSIVDRIYLVFECDVLIAGRLLQSSILIALVARITDDKVLKARFSSSMKLVTSMFASVALDLRFTGRHSAPTPKEFYLISHACPSCAWFAVAILLTPARTRSSFYCFSMFLIGFPVHSSCCSSRADNSFFFIHHHLTHSEGSRNQHLLPESIIFTFYLFL
jgi:hypothetical protein